MTTKKVIYHRLVQQDMNFIREYYIQEADPALADRFYLQFQEVISKIKEMPERYHCIHAELRRAEIVGFPYHILYRITDHNIRVLILRHNKRHPSYGLKRQ